MKCPKCGHSWSVKKREGVKYRHFDHVLLTEEENRKLEEKFGVIGTTNRIKNLDDAIAIHGYKYKDHYRVILKWEPKSTNILEDHIPTQKERDKMDENYRTGKTVGLKEIGERVMADLKKKKNGGK